MILVLHPEFLRWIPLLLMIATTGTAASATAELMRSRVEHLRTEQNPTIRGASIAAAMVLADFYERREFNLAWTAPEKIADLIRLLESADEHGLDPRDYHLPAIETLRRGNGAQMPTARQRVDLDLLLTDSLVSFAYHTRFGKVDPASLDSNWNFERRPITEHPVGNLETAIGAGSLEQFVRQLIPEPYFYQWLRRGLTRYRQIHAAGGWRPIPGGPSLKVGAMGPRVEQLRERLRRTGDLTSADPADAALFDKALEVAVITFQARHGLDRDGVVGARTLRALNIPIETRIDQIRVNLERMRWVYQNLPDDYLLLDIAGYNAYLVRHGQEIWKARTQVGRPYRETPVFRADMRYLVFNPLWTVPPIILINDVLPEARREPAYLTRNQMRLVDDTGQTVSIDAVDWASVSAWNFPYTVRQDPGPNNALGRVKFVFPNKHLVYLHDTPSKNLFEHSQRTFSSGCIRVERPFELAELLLEDVAHWNAERIQRVLASGQTETVHLASPVPVLLFYWTAKADESGTVHFRADIYGRDQRVLRVLRKPFKFRALPA
nr:L,D-transpeptidase family protein [Gammaproteobacteria bacterium]